MMLPPARPEPPDGARHGAVAINMPEPQPRSPSSEYADPPPPYSDGSLSSGHGTPISHSLVGTPTKKRPPPSPPVRRGSPQGAIQGLQHIPVQFRPFVVGALLVTIFLLSSMLMLPDIRPARTAQPPIQWVSKMTTSVHVHWGKEHADEELVKQYVTAVVTSPFAKPPRNYLSICAIVRNEEVGPDRASCPKFRCLNRAPF